MFGPSFNTLTNIQRHFAPAFNSATLSLDLHQRSAIPCLWCSLLLFRFVSVACYASFIECCVLLTSQGTANISDYYSAA
jgi:hypothetical protein